MASDRTGYRDILVVLEGRADHIAKTSLEVLTKARELAMRLEQIDVFAIACSGLGASLWAAGRSREAIEALPYGDDPETAVGERRALARLMGLVHALGPPDRQVLLLYLEDLDAAAIGEVTGLSPGAVATKIHRLKALLARRFAEGGRA